MYRYVGTLLLLSARYIWTDCSGGTRGSFSPTKNNVGVVTFATSFKGEWFRNNASGAFFCHGVPPNQIVRPARISVCAYMDAQSAAPAPADAALNRVVMVISLFVRWPPALHPIIASRSGSAMPRLTNEKAD